MGAGRGEWLIVAPAGAPLDAKLIADICDIWGEASVAVFTLAGFG